jgi:hypothetical protein
VRFPGHRSLQILIQGLAVPAVAALERHVNPAAIILTGRGEQDRRIKRERPARARRGCLGVEAVGILCKWGDYPFRASVFPFVRPRVLLGSIMKYVVSAAF